MRKNIFCLIIDALSFPCFNDRYNAMPFLKSLCEKGHNCVNMYSQGPYTEAALTPFYTGRDNMDFGGNLFRGNQTEQTVFEAFEKNGYDVLNYTQPLIYPKPMHRGINEERYGVSYFFSAVWDYRLAHFSKLYENNSLSDKDYANIEELLKANFEFWLEYLSACKQKDEAADFVNLYSDSDFDFDLRIKQVTEQYIKFSADKTKYVEELFKQKEQHEVFRIDNYFMTSKCKNDQLYDEIAKKFQTLFEKIECFNKKHNKSADYSLLALMKICFNLLIGKKAQAINSAKKYHYYKRIYSTKKEISNMFELKSNYKPEPTILKYFEHFCKWYVNRNGERPYYCTMHISDLHTPEIFFSIDSDNIGEVGKELNVINEFIDSLPADFDGNIMYWLSMRYVDYCVERMFKRMEENGMLHSTLFIVTADHGSSFGFRPVRTSIVNNEHDENYHIPCIIVGEDVEPFVDERFFTTKDIAKTITEYVDIHNSEFTGRSVLNTDYESDYAITEYLGAGCPDIKEKPIEFIIRDNKYSLGMRQKISEKFSAENAYCVYNRKEDAQERVNIKGTINLNDIKFLIDKIELRFNQIKGDYYAN